MVDKAFENTYEDYDENSKLFDLEKEELLPEIESDLREKMFKLFEEFEKNLQTLTEWSENNLYSGQSGIAFLYLRFAQLKEKWEGKEDKDFLKDAVSHIEPAMANLEPKKLSFLSGISGNLCTAAAVLRLSDKENECEDISRRCQNLGEEVCRAQFPDDIMHGRSGFLVSMLYLEKYGSPDEFRHLIMEEIVKTILETGKHLSKKFVNTNNLPLYFDWHKKVYVGAAHGISGILHSLLLARKYVPKEQMEELVRPAIDKLLELQAKNGNFPLSLENPVDNLVHWCHGASGCCHLLLLAYEVFTDDNEKYLEIAKSCGDLIWEKGLIKKGCSLCHGVAGNGYVFLRLFQVTRDIKYLHRAVKFADWCYDQLKDGLKAPNTSLSLFEGLAGVIYYMLEVLHPLQAAMPGFYV